jgi:hypothetical protein
MELDDLKATWQRMDQRLARQAALNFDTAASLQADRARRQLWPVVVGQVLQLLVFVPLIGVFAPFWFAHRSELLPLVSGLLMHAWCLAIVVSSVMQLYLVAQVNNAGPVLAIQRNIERLSLWRVRVSPWLGMAFWLLWIPFIEVLVRSATGRDVGHNLLEWGVPFSLFGLLLSLAFRHWLRQPARRHHGEAIDRSHAGRSVLRAQSFLDEIARFERE